MKSVLIVDDEPIAAQNIAEIIKRYCPDFFTVGIAHSALEAIDFLHQPLTPTADIVITDIKMPNISGIELIKRIRELDERIQILVISGYSDYEYVRGAMKAGATDYILKPVVPENFVSVISGMDGGENDQESRLCRDMNDVDSRFAGIKSYVDTHITDAITLNDISEIFNISKTYINILFNKNVGMPFKQYCTQIRMSLAKKLIDSNPGMLISDVAKKTGIEDPLYFSKVFKLYAGVSPTEYRERDRNH